MLLITRAAMILSDPALTPEQKSAAMIKLGFRQKPDGGWTMQTGPTVDQIIKGTAAVAAVAVPGAGAVVAAGQQIVSSAKTAYSSITMKPPAPPGTLPLSSSATVAGGGPVSEASIGGLPSGLVFGLAGVLFLLLLFKRR